MQEDVAVGGGSRTLSPEDENKLWSLRLSRKDKELGEGGWGGLWLARGY